MRTFEAAIFAAATFVAVRATVGRIRKTPFRIQRNGVFNSRAFAL
jgi:hypothetical protein